MNDLKLTSSYDMRGDQPKAVDQLTASVQRGDRFQTLLGATGTGKSVGADQPVTVHLEGQRYYRGPIGHLIDSAFGSEQRTHSPEVAPPGNWRILAWSPTTGQTDWRPITGLSRHSSPADLFRLTT